jgi:hypothetical protein
MAWAAIVFGRIQCSGFRSKRARITGFSYRKGSACRRDAGAPEAHFGQNTPWNKAFLDASLLAKGMSYAKS